MIFKGHNFIQVSGFITKDKPCVVGTIYAPELELVWFYISQKFVMRKKSIA